MNYTSFLRLPIRSKRECSIKPIIWCRCAFNHQKLHNYTISGFGALYAYLVLHNRSAYCKAARHRILLVVSNRCFVCCIRLVWIIIAFFTIRFAVDANNWSKNLCYVKYKVWEGIALFWCAEQGYTCVKIIVIVFKL